MRHGRERHLFRGLQDERVAADDRDREHPERNHGREIERRDARADADRMANGLAINLAGDVGERLAHDQAGHAAGELDHLDAAMDRRTGLGERLAVLACDQVCQLLGVSGQLFAKAKHHAGPFDDRRLDPGRQGVGRRLHGPVDLVGRAERHAGDRAAVRRVEDRARSARPARLPLAADQQFYGRGRIAFGLGRGHREVLRERGRPGILTLPRSSQVASSLGKQPSAVRKGWQCAAHPCRIVNMLYALILKELSCPASSEAA